MRFTASLATSLATLLALPGATLAQSNHDSTVRALRAPPVHRSAGSGSSPVVMHQSGDLIMAAEGVLRTDPEGATRFYHSDPEIIDVASGGDGGILGMARFPASRPTSIRVVRLAANGTPAWTRVLHRQSVDAYTYPDITAAPNGDAIVCSTVHMGRNDAVVIDRIDPRGNVVFSRTVAPHGECHTVATDGMGNIYWTGATTTGRTTVATLERLTPNGASVFRRSWDAYPLSHEMLIAPNGDIIVAGSFEGSMDLLPGPRVHLAIGHGHTAFATRFNASGDGLWAWNGGPSTVASIVLRGSDTLIVEAGTMTRLDAQGQQLQRTVFGTPVRDGTMGEPFLSITGAVVDAQDRVVLVGGLPAPDALGGAEFHFLSGQPYRGPHGAILARPGW